jgi:hypothetical protein
MLSAAATYLIFAFAISLTWYLPRYAHYVPKWLAEWMYPIDKTNLDVLRFAHFLAIAALTVRFVPRDWAGLGSPLLRPAILCGQNSLEIFCLGVFLAFAAHFAMIEFSDGLWMQVVVSAAGILAMVATAALISWYKRVERRGSGPQSEPPEASLAEGRT